MVSFLALLLVLLLFGGGFAVHLQWIAAAIFLVLWIVGFAIGRYEGAGFISILSAIATHQRRASRERPLFSGVVPRSATRDPLAVARTAAPLGQWEVFRIQPSPGDGSTARKS